MEFIYETQGSNTFLVYQVQESQEIDRVTLGMMNNNKIEGIIPVSFTQMDDERYFKYNVSSKITGKQCFEGTVTKKRVLGVFSSMLTSILEAEEYMIDLQSMVIDLDYIFIDVSTNKASLICVPIMKMGKNIDLKLFFKNIIFSTQYDQSENCDYVAKIISCLNNDSTFSLMELKKVIDDILDEIEGSSNKCILEQNNVPVMVENTAINEINNNMQVSISSTNSENDNNANNNTIFNNQVMPENNNNFSINNGMAVPGMVSNFGMVPTGSGINKKINKNKKKNNEKRKESKGVFSFFGRKKNKKESSEPLSHPSEYVGDKFNYETPQVGYSMPSSTTTENQPNFILNQQKTACNCIPMDNNVGETTVLGSNGIGETTVLDQRQDNLISPYLIRVKNNEKIQLNKPVFRIGKEKSYVDYFIGDNTAISRSHASIITCNDEYFIEDTNSTNHTYVDGNIIQSNVKVKLNHGTKVKLANEEFEFRMY